MCSSDLNKKEIEKYKENWVATFSPNGANKKEIKKLCLSKRKCTPFLWHIFSFDFLSSEVNPSECYNNADKMSCVLISNIDEIGFVLCDAEKLTAEILNDFIDVTIFDKAFAWTYCKTHESMCGPYYYRK